MTPNTKYVNGVKGEVPFSASCKDFWLRGPDNALGKVDWLSQHKCGGISGFLV